MKTWTNFTTITTDDQYMSTRSEVEEENGTYTTAEVMIIDTDVAVRVGVSSIIAEMQYNDIDGLFIRRPECQYELVELLTELGKDDNLEFQGFGTLDKNGGILYTLTDINTVLP